MRAECQLGLLERKQGLLHADCREQHELRDARVLCRLQRLHMCLVIDGPGVGRHTGARGQARDQRVEAFTAKAVPRQRRRVLHIAESQRGAGQQPLAVSGRQRATGTGVGANEADHLVPALHERAHRRAADRAGGAEHEDAAWLR